MFINVMIDEDGYICVEEGELLGYKWRGMVRDGENSMSRVVSRDELDEVIKEMKGIGCRVGGVGVRDEWFGSDEVGMLEGVKFDEGVERLGSIDCNGKIGMYVRWSVEYDDNLILVYEIERDLDDSDEYVEDDKGCMEWYGREYDEGEFEE